MSELSASPATRAWDYRVGVATREHHADIEALRRVAFEHSKEFAWNDLSALGWSPGDDEGTVVATWDRAGRMHSAFRVTLCSQADQAERLMEYSLAGIELPVPCGVLTLAATLPTRAGQGLFALARYGFAQSLMSTPVQSLVTQIYAGGSRVESMRKKGYVMHEPTRSWDSEARAIAPPVLAVLERAQFEHAMEGARQDIDSNVLALYDTEAIAADLSRQCLRLR